VSEEKIPFEKLIAAYEVMEDIFAYAEDWGAGMPGWSRGARRHSSAEGKRVVEGYLRGNYCEEFKRWWGGEE
jgi:hypothetical protein